MDQTLTEVDAPTRATPMPGTLGRYRIEYEVGAGGMGVVYAAFDPELERRVALKVLPDGTADKARRDGLLREARAMARLAHPNVVHVYEVGSVDGRDFVAMELVDGGTLKEWLQEKRDRGEVLSAFLAAGAGLTAAHDAGLIHRDFKPHNVLRWRDGRVQVVDFGLARAVGEVEASPAGTPAYMAPEQWIGGAPAGPAADQFAFCVALWEGLAGERPYSGHADDIRAAVMAGPADLDDRAIPAALRPILKRGLAVEPAARFPSMAALLAAIARTRRSRALPIAVGLTAVAAGVALLLAARGRHVGCPDPLLDPDVVWPEGSEARLTAKGQGLAARAIAADIASWKSIRVGACDADPDARAPRLACLDAVMQTLAAVERGAELADKPGVDAGDLVDPNVCAADPPRLAPRTLLVDELVSELARLSPIGGQQPEAKWRAYLPRAAGDPCALEILDQILSRRATSLEAERALLDEADSAAQRCGDDDLSAALAVEVAKFEAMAGTNDGRFAPKLARADAAVSHIRSADWRSELEVVRYLDDYANGRFDSGLAHAEAAVDGFASRHRTAYALELEINAIDMRRLRGAPVDIEVVPSLYAKYRALGVQDLGADHEWVRKLDREIAGWTFMRGDVAASHALFERAYRPFSNGDHVERVAGVVVDASGKPVAGARVTVGSHLACDRVGIVATDDTIRRATTDAAGRFAIEDAVTDGTIVADLGDLQSSPQAVAHDPIRLALAPTARVDGQVELHGILPSRVGFLATAVGQPPDTQFMFGAPLDAQGHFTFERVPRGKLHIMATWVAGARVDQRSQVAVDVDVEGPEAHGVTLELTTSSRLLQVIIRSTIATSVPRAYVVVFAGDVHVTNLREMQDLPEHSHQTWAHTVDGTAPQVVRAHARPGDLYAPVTAAPEGTATACAIDWPPEVGEPALSAKVLAHLERVEVRCVPVAATDEVVVVEVPPFPRFD